MKVLDFGLAKALAQAEGASSRSSSAVADHHLSRDDADGHHPRHRRLHVVRAGTRQGGRQSRGRVGVRRRAVRDAQRPAAIPGRRSPTRWPRCSKRADWNALPHTTPSSVRRVLRSCLEKDPRRRLQAIGDRRLLVDDPVQPTTIRGSPSVTIVAVGVAAVLAVALVTLSVVHFREPVAVAMSSPVARVAIALPPESELAREIPALALSPDGTRLSMPPRREPLPQLFLRALDGTEQGPSPAPRERILRSSHPTGSG